MKTTEIAVPANHEVVLCSDNNFKIELLQDSKTVKKVPFVDANNGALFRCREETTFVCHGKTPVVAVITDISNALENLDVIPIDVPVDERQGMTLQDKMKSLIHDYAANYFGDNQMDKLEDVLNIDLDEDGLIGTSEIPEAIPELPVMPEEVIKETPEPAPPETPVETTPDPTPAP